jgi:hypothetical protein
MLSTNTRLFLLRLTYPLHYSVYATFGYIYLIIAVINTLIDAEFPERFEYSLFNVVARLFWVILALFMFWQSRFTSPSKIKDFGYLFSWSLLASLIIFYIYHRITPF